MIFSIVIIALLALTLIIVVVLPLLNRQFSDPVPNFDNPLEEDLTEERDALFRAIAELENQPDLSEARRQQLRARYEAKAAQILKSLDNLNEPVKAKKARSLPVAVLLLLVLIVPSIVLIGNYVLPRVGNATVTTAFEDQIRAGREIKNLENAVRKDPTLNNLLDLANAYWVQGTSDPGPNPNAILQEDMANYRQKAADTYRQIEQEFSDGDVPAVVFQRLGLIALNDEASITGSISYLEKARSAEPQNLDTLLVLGELYFYEGRMYEAVNAWEDFLASPGGSEEEAVVAPRLEAARKLAPLQESVSEEASEANLMALADVYWELKDRVRAGNLYYRVLTEANPGTPNPVAIQRLGIAMFFSGDNEQAALVLEQARFMEPENLETLLFLGNTYFSMGQLEQAVEVWNNYVEVAGGPENAGRVPSLIEQAQRQLAGEPFDPVALLGQDANETSTVQNVLASGEQIFNASCASCHGVGGVGNIGPRLVGNQRLSPEIVLNTVSYGRNMMPGFGALLSTEELSAVVDYVIEISQQ